MVAVPSIGRASGITPRRAAREADATRELYERYARQIYSFCYRQLGSKEEAEDATQSTFLNAFRGYMRGVDPEYESAWIYKIAENVCLTRQRSSTRRRRVEAASDLDAMQDFVPAHQSDSDELIRLPEALDAMPEQQRRALLLREWQGLSYKEIAEELDLSQAAVETLLFRARRSLAAGLTDEVAQPKKGIAKRMRAGGDLGSLVTLVKSILFTGGAKVAATVATVAATSVVAATPVARHAVEHVVDPAPAPAKHHIVKHPTTAGRSVGAAHLSGAKAAALVAHRGSVAGRGPVSTAHRAVAKRVATAHVATATTPVHAATVSHVESTTDIDATTAATATPPAAADPAQPTTSSPPASQPAAPSTPAATPTTSNTPTTAAQPSGGGTTTPTTKDKDNGTTAGSSSSSSSSSSATGTTTATAPNGKTFSTTSSQPTQPAATTTPSTSGSGGTTSGQTQDKTTSTTGKTVVVNPTQTLAPATATTQPTTTPSTTTAPTTTQSTSTSSSTTTTTTTSTKTFGAVSTDGISSTGISKK